MVDVALPSDRSISANSSFYIVDVNLSALRACVGSQKRLLLAIQQLIVESTVQGSTPIST